MSSLSKIAISGVVVKTPEKRFTTNNLAITTFNINIGADSEEKIIRVSAIGKLAETVAETVAKSSRVLIDGKLQTGVVKTQNGEERKILEITAQAIEVISAATGAYAVPVGVKADNTAANADLSPGMADSMDMDIDFPDDELIGEDEIPF